MSTYLYSDSICRPRLPLHWPRLFSFVRKATFWVVTLHTQWEYILWSSYCKCIDGRLFHAVTVCNHYELLKGFLKFNSSNSPWWASQLTRNPDQQPDWRTWSFGHLQPPYGSVSSHRSSLWIHSRHHLHQTLNKKMMMEQITMYTTMSSKVIMQWRQ